MQPFPLLLGLLFLAGSTVARAQAPTAPLPERLSQTGLFEPGSTSRTRAGVLPFTPQYPLWSDGAAKRRWMALPPGSAIDASNPDAWQFPRGTRLWKEFSHGERIETRFIERLPSGEWRYASYVWKPDGSDAVLAPAQGVAAVPATQAPGGSYRVPSRADCVACHEASVVPVLGVSALQLSSERDPQALHAETPGAGFADLPGLLGRGYIRKLPAALQKSPPRITASSPSERSALGYLHANCGHCHNAQGPLAGLGLQLAYALAPGASASRETLQSLIGASSRYRAHGSTAQAQRVAPGDAQASTLVQRMRSGNALSRMPPLGVSVVDAQAITHIERWIDRELSPPPTP